MAKITLGEEREQESSYQLYKQSSGGDQIVVVRRKLAMASDVEHKSSRETQRQRERFGAASTRWASIPGVVKADLREKYGIVMTQTAHGLSEPKVLQGAQLFVSQEIHQEKYHQEHAPLPWWLCICTTDPLGRVIDIPLELAVWDVLGYVYCPRYYLTSGNTFFFPIERGRQYYQVSYAEAGWYRQIAFRYAEDEIKKLRYQVVHPNITVAHAEYYNWETHPYQENWQAVPPPQETDLAQYQVHHLISWDPFLYHPDPAISFTWRRVTHGIHSLTITLLNLRYEMEIILSHELYQSTLWTITKDIFGRFHLKPPMRTCNFALANWQIINYEE